MHLDGFGKTDGLPYQAFDPCTQCGVFAFDLLCMLFPNRMLVRINVTTIGLGRLNWLLSVDRFLDSRCQSRLSSAWRPRIFKEVQSTRAPPWRPMIFFITI